MEREDSTPQEDLGDALLPPDSSSLVKQLADAEVVGVGDIVYRKICFKSLGTVDDVDETIGICSRCSLAQRLDRCIIGLSAKLFIEKDTDQLLTLSASHTVLKKITENDSTDDSTSMEELTKSLLIS